MPADPAPAAAAATSPVNEQVVAAVGATAGFVMAAAPKAAEGMALQAFAHATALAMANATESQAGMQQINKAAIAAVIAQIMQTGRASP